MKKGIISSLRLFRRHILIDRAIKEDKIKEFDSYIYDNLKNNIYNVLPSIVYIRYFRPTHPPGNCMERSFIISVAIPGSSVAYGYIPGTGIHYWVEFNGVCYDPTSLYAYERDSYYKINSIYNSGIITNEELETLGFIQYCKGKTVDDVKNNPLLMEQLDVTLAIITKGSEYLENPEFKSLIDDYMKKMGFALSR